jgi:hypothetical protein
LDHPDGLQEEIGANRENDREEAEEHPKVEEAARK